MSVFNARIVNNGSCCISPRISDQSSANDNTQRLATTETTEPHGNFNLFHFQNDQMWPVNMTGKTKGWPVNPQISSDIVRWPAVISSPAIIESLFANQQRYPVLSEVYKYSFLAKNISFLYSVHCFCPRELVFHLIVIISMEFWGSKLIFCLRDIVWRGNSLLKLGFGLRSRDYLGHWRHRIGITIAKYADFIS